MNAIAQFPPIKWMIVHPRLAAWIALSVGMIVLLVIEARDIGLLPLQWVALLTACVLVAGACVWIISWEDSDDDPAADDKADAPSPTVVSTTEADPQREPPKA
ncbi:MAG: hypothetical protein SF162_17285 [bacterium]|nr:hypothetical protein [bacterium]